MHLFFCFLGENAQIFVIYGWNKFLIKRKNID